MGKVAVVKKPEVSLIADLHLDEYSDFATWSGAGRNSRLEAQVRTLCEAFESGDMGPVLVIAGDMAHRRARLTAGVVDAIRRVLECANEHFVGGVYVIPGNHDYPLRRGGDVHALTAFKDLWGRVEIIDSYQKRPLPRSGLHLIPWQWEASTFRKLAEEAAMAGDPCDLLVCHQGIHGATVHGGAHATTSEISLADLNPGAFGMVFLGDYHDTGSLAAVCRAAKVSNVHSIGSPYQLSRAEALDTDKGYCAVTGGVLRRVLLPGPRFVTAPVVVDEDSLKATVARFKDSRNFVDVPLGLGVSVAQARRLAETVGAKNLSFAKEPPPVRTESRSSKLALSSGSGVLDVMEAYLATVPTATVDLATLGVVVREIAESVVHGSIPYNGPVVFKTLVVENFLSWGSVGLDLEDRGLVLIDGENQDLPGVTKSNGAGKSVLVEALYFALFGKTLRGRGPKGLPVDRLVNRFVAKGKMLVELTIVTGEHSILIRRGRGKSGSPTLALVVDGVDLTPGGSVEHLEERIRLLVGLSEESFRASVLFGQTVERYFAASSPTEQQVVLDQLAGVSRFDPYIAAARKEHSAMLLVRDGAQRALERAQAGQQASAAHRVAVDLRWQQWVVDAAAVVAEAEEAIPEAEGVLFQAKVAASAALKALPVKYQQDSVLRSQVAQEMAALEGERRGITATAEDVEGALARLSDARLSETRTANALRRATEDLARLETAHAALPPVAEVESRVEAAVGRVGWCRVALEGALAKSEVAEGATFPQQVVDTGEALDCPTCSRSMTVAVAKRHTQQARREAQAVAEAWAGKLEGLRNDLNLAEGDLAQARGELRALREGLEALAKARHAKQLADSESQAATWTATRAQDQWVASQAKVDKARELDASVEALHGVAAAVVAYDLARGGVVAAEKSLEALKARTVPGVNPHTGTLEDAKGALARAVEAEASARRDLDATDLLMPVYEFAPTLFQNLKMFVYDALAPAIEEEANRAFSVMTDGHFRLRLAAATSKTGSRERLVLEVENDTGADSYEGDSGGEQRVVDVALLLALHAVNGSRVAFLKADEALAPCDEVLSRRIVRAFKQRAEALGGTVLFTSHREEMKGEFDRVWFAVKSGGVTRMEVLS